MLPTLQLNIYSAGGARDRHSECSQRHINFCGNGSMSKYFSQLVNLKYFQCYMIKHYQTLQWYVLLPGNIPYHIAWKYILLYPTKHYFIFKNQLRINIILCIHKRKFFFCFAALKRRRKNWLSESDVYANYILLSILIFLVSNWLVFMFLIWWLMSVVFVYFVCFVFCL